MSDDERNDRAPSVGDVDEEGPQPWAKASASTESLAADDDENDEDE